MGGISEKRSSMNRYPDPPPQPESFASERLAYSQRIARVVLTLALVLAGLWILHRFLPALAWAGVLAIALRPLYRHVARALPGGEEGVPAPLLVTLLVGLIFTAPFVYVVIEGAREA